jgi:transposase-like protein
LETRRNRTGQVEYWGRLLPLWTLTKTKGAFPNDNSLLKLLFAGIQNAEKTWTMPIRKWSLTISQLNIYFKERLKDALDLV